MTSRQSRKVTQKNQVDSIRRTLSQDFVEVHLASSPNIRQLRVDGDAVSRIQRLQKYFVIFSREFSFNFVTLSLYSRPPVLLVLIHLLANVE